MSIVKGGSQSGREDCHHAVTDEALCTLTGCALGTDVCHWMFKIKVNMVQGQEDGPLRSNWHGNCFEAVN